MGPLLAVANPSGDIGFQTANAWQWLLVAGALAIATGIAAAALLAGREERSLPMRLALGAERIFRMPAWAAFYVVTALWSLCVAVLGFEWDVAWHADYGRDRVIFTVPHTLILMGLGGLLMAALLGILFATLTQSPAGWRVRRWQVPYSALPMSLIGIGAVLGFPLDDLWHRAFGIDVTMWSPTHLMMIGAASLATIGVYLALVEAGQGGRRAVLLVGGSLLVGLSTFQLEYDMGIPQWQVIFQPLLIAGAAAAGLIAVRVAGGRGMALASVAAFWVLRGILLLVIGYGFHDTLPRFPLYLGEALIVEAAFFIAADRRPLLTALLAGLGVGSVGVLCEAPLVNAWYLHTWDSRLLLAAIPEAAICGLAMAPVGLALGDAGRGRRAQAPAAVVTAGLLVFGGAIAYHLFARAGQPVQFTVAAQPVGTIQPLRDRDGNYNPGGPVNLELTASPASAVDQADFFEAVAWQGRAPVVHRRLISEGGGRYRVDGTVPTGGEWKTMIVVGRGDGLTAVPISMPADRAYGLAPVAAPINGEEQRPGVPASKVLMREYQAGGAPIGPIAYAAFLLFLALWVASLALAASRIAVSAEPAPAESVRKPVIA